MEFNVMTLADLLEISILRAMRDYYKMNPLKAFDNINIITIYVIDSPSKWFNSASLFLSFYIKENTINEILKKISSLKGLKVNIDESTTPENQKKVYESR